MKRSITVALVVMAVVLCCFTNTAYANATWGLIYLDPTSRWLIPVTLLIELPGVWVITKRSLARCLIIDVVMNVASFIVGWFPLAIVMMMMSGICSPGSWRIQLAATAFSAVVLNTIVEGGVIMLIGRVPFSLKGMSVVALVNTITTALGAFAALPRPVS